MGQQTTRTVFYVINFAIAIAMVVIGSTYFSEKECKMEKVPLFLIVAGSLEMSIIVSRLIFDLLEFRGYCTCESVGNKIYVISYCLGLLLWYIWGAVVVFGKFR